MSNVKSIAAAPAIPKLYKKGHPSYCIELPTSVLFNALRIKGQRFEENRVEKDHLNNWYDRHHIFGIAVTPDEKIFLLDGYGRCLNITTGRLTIPSHFSEFIYEVHSVESVDELFGRYMCFDPKDAAKNPSDMVQSTMSLIGFHPKTKFLSEAKGVASALTIAIRGYRIGAPLLRIPKKMPEKAKFDIFKDELALLDGLDVNHDYFKSGYLAGALLVLKKDPVLGLEFIDRYASKVYAVGDAVWYCHQALIEARRAKRMASSAPNEHAQVFVGCAAAFFRDKTKLRKRAPVNMSTADFIAS